jgi:trans-aconitate 2-methyltransferase
VTPRDWNAAVYDRVSDPQLEWGREVLERTEFRGDELALDGGCGTGRVTRLLAERVRRLVACDIAPSMVAAARAALPGVEVFECDLLDLELRQPVDVVLSTAVFHWIDDHDRLFERLHAALRPGGRLIAQCGGEGNIARLRGAVETVRGRFPLQGVDRTWNFQSPEATTARLERTGFSDVRCWLELKEVSPPDLHAYLATVALCPFVEALDDPAPFVDGVIAKLGDSVDYVRLNIEATA